MSQKNIENTFPKLITSGYNITSPEDEDYNCISWAVKDKEYWWWPDPLGQKYWPDGVKREETVEAFIKAYETRGFIVCDNGDFEKDHEKIAIYVDDKNNPKHAARQLSNGHWTSKLGKSEDIEHHSLVGVSGKIYGEVAVFLKRKISE